MAGNMISSKKETTGLLLIGIVMAYWGFTTVLMKHALLYMSSVTYIMLRFCVAAAVLAPLYAKRLWEEKSRGLLLHGFILGLLQIIPMEFTTIALRYTTAANSVFISQLSFVMVPLIQCMLFRRLPDRTLCVTIAGLLLGLAVFSDVMGQGLDTGSILCIVVALFNSIHILCVKRFARADASQLLGVMQVFFCALLSIPVWLVNPGKVIWCAESVSLLFFTGVIGSAVAFVVQVVGQARTTPVKASFLGLLQPVFAMAGGAVLADAFGNVEPITGHMALGAVVIMSVLAAYLRKAGEKART